MGFNREVFSKMTAFLESLSLKEPVRSQFGHMTMELKKRYYGLTADHRELFIHRNSFPDLVNFLAHRGIDQSRISQVHIPAPACVPVDYVVLPQYVLRDYQEIIVEELADLLYSRRLDLQTGKESPSAR